MSGDGFERHGIIDMLIRLAMGAAGAAGLSAGA